MLKNEMMLPEEITSGHIALPAGDSLTEFITDLHKQIHAALGVTPDMVRSMKRDRDLIAVNNIKLREFGE